MYSESDKSATFHLLIACNGQQGRLENASHSQIPTISTVITDSFATSQHAIGQQQFDLIVIDSGLDYTRLVAHAKENGKNNTNTPLIALIAPEIFTNRGSFIKSGFDDCLDKPLTADKLKELIDLWRPKDELRIIFDGIDKFFIHQKINRTLAEMVFIQAFEEIPKLIRQIEEGLEKRQFDLAFNAAHKMKGYIALWYIDDLAQLIDSLKMSLKEEKKEFAEGFLMMLRQNLSTYFSKHNEIACYIQDKLRH